LGRVETRKIRWNCAERNPLREFYRAAFCALPFNAPLL
jgi:hypothetical protein